MNSWVVESLPGQASFAEVHERMLALVQERIEDRIPDTLLFCEHQPVITRGRGLQWREDRTERAKPLSLVPPGTDYQEIERGGDLTWHGPGQLVLYPIVKLGGSGRIGGRIGQDVDAYIRFLEALWIHALARFGILAESRPGGSGVWRQGKKLGSVGIAVRRWVTYHGSAVNVLNPLEPFQIFSPCGFPSEVMTRLADQVEIPRDWFGEDWRARWEKLILEGLPEVLG